MAAQKTLPTRASVAAFLRAAAPGERGKDCAALSRIMRGATGARPVMWGRSMVGFGRFRFRPGTGGDGEWPLTAFAPRKEALVVYIMPSSTMFPGLMKRLGKHRHGSSCVYISRLADVDVGVLTELVRASVARVKEMYGGGGRGSA